MLHPEDFMHFFVVYFLSSLLSSFCGVQERNWYRTVCQCPISKTVLSFWIS